MDFLNKSYAQLADLFRDMTPGARITTALLTVVIVVSLVFLFRTQTNQADEMLFGGREFSSTEMAAMEPAFAKAGLSKSEIVGNRIRVPRGQKADYLAALVDANALPQDPGSFFRLAEENDGPFTSNQARRDRLKNAKQRELSLILGRMKDIEYATLYFDESTGRGFPRTKEKTVTVAVKAVGNNRLSDEQVRSIRNLVSSAYAGMKRTMVTITDMNGGSYPGGDGESDATAYDNRFAETKARFEKQWFEKIRKTLSEIPGVLVGVNVTLNPELHNSTTSVKIDPNAVSLSTKENTVDSKTSSASPGGRPGAVPNGVIGTNTPATIGAGPATESEVNKTSSENRSVASQDHIRTVVFPLTPKQVKASIRVPSSYILKIWNKKNPPAAGEEETAPDPAALQALEALVTEEIKRSVLQILPSLGALDNPDPLVLVSTFSDFASPQAIKPGFTEHAYSWLASYWQALGMTLVGLFSLLMLRSMIRSVPKEIEPQVSAAPQSLSVDELEEEEEEEEAADSILGLKNRKPSNVPDLRKELTDMVHEDLDAAANVLRNWIGDAA